MRPIALLAVAWCVAVRPPGLASAQASLAEMHRRYVAFEAAAVTGTPAITGPLEVTLTPPTVEPDTLAPSDGSRRARVLRYMRAATDTMARLHALDVVWYTGEVLRPLIP